LQHFFAGIAGVIYAHNVGTLKPTTFDYNKSIEILVIVVLGGMGSIKGSVIAAIILTVLPEMLRSADEFRMFLYAVVLIAMMIFNSSQLKQRILSSSIFLKLKRNKEA
jgi:branched-chain amino acid transport system permease protein